MSYSSGIVMLMFASGTRIFDGPPRRVVATFVRFPFIGVVLPLDGERPPPLERAVPLLALAAALAVSDASRSLDLLAHSAVTSSSLMSSTTTHLVLELRRPSTEDDLVGYSGRTYLGIQIPS
jgi:hypothetical protein